MRPPNAGRLRNRYQLGKCVDELLKMTLREQTRPSIHYFAAQDIPFNWTHLDAVVCWAQRCDKTISFSSSDYEIELATRQTTRNNWTVRQLESSQLCWCSVHQTQLSQRHHGQAVISCGSTAWVPLTIATKSHNMLECIRNVRMSRVTLHRRNNGLPSMSHWVVHCMFTYEAKCDSLSCQFLSLPRPVQHCHASIGVQQRVECTGCRWSRPTPLRILMNTRPSSAVWIRYSFLVHKWLLAYCCFFASKEPFHADNRLSHCSVCATHLFQLSNT